MNMYIFYEYIWKMVNCTPSYSMRGCILVTAFYNRHVMATAFDQPVKLFGQSFRISGDLAAVVSSVIFCRCRILLINVDSSFGDHCSSLIALCWELWRIWIKISSLLLLQKYGIVNYSLDVKAATWRRSFCDPCCNNYNYNYCITVMSFFCIFSFYTL